jgi:hypothetical protein
MYLGENKLKILNYYDELKTRVDLYVELYTYHNRFNSERINKVNAAREQWFNEHDTCLKFNIDELEKREDKHMLLEERELFKRFCFIFQVYGDVFHSGRFTWRFISTDMFLSPGQIACLEAALFFNQNDTNFNSNILSFDVINLLEHFMKRLFIPSVCDSFKL